MDQSTDSSGVQISGVRLCGDFLATRESEQASNLRWFGDLLERPITSALASCTVCRGLTDPLDRAALLEGAVDKRALADRHCWFDPGAVAEKSIDTICQAVGVGTLVVGYELSPMTRTVLDRAGLAWLDIWLHPVRFADDVLFGLRASDRRMQSRLSKFAIADESLWAQADILRVQNYRGFAKFESSLSPGSALFICQTARDKSVLDRNGFLNILDFRSEFSGIARNHSHVYFSRHPNEPRLDREVDAFLKSHGNVSEITAPAYHLLADPRIATVASISSSILEEARYFGKDVWRFFRPPFPLTGDDAYTTVLQDFCFSHFWAAILQDLADTRDCAPAGFVDPKNKLRHALSFYWGYRFIDKAELASMPANATIPSEPARPTLETAELVSFDVFDTLITRRYADPADVFVAIAAKASEIIGSQSTNFVDRRRAAERAATARANRAGREDPTLAEIYQSLLSCDFDDPRVAELCAMEIAEELKSVLPRPVGAKLYQKARQAGRRIVLLSDMYLPRDTVESLLKHCGYEGWDDLYLSSEYGLTKRSGTLFRRLQDDTALPVNGILHIGDNQRGDQAVPESLGIACRPLPKAIEIMRTAAPFLRKGTNRIAEANTLNGSRMIALIAQRNYDEPASDPQTDALGRDAETFGYIALGPLLAGFSDWLNRRATERDIQTLGFLTREGPVMRAAWEALFPQSAIKAKTVFASRRIVRPATIVNREQIARIFRDADPGRYRDWDEFLDVQFGVRDCSASRSGIDCDQLPDLTASIGPRASEVDHSNALSTLQQPILQHAIDARVNLRAYLDETGLSGDRAGVVDIGYAGRVQAAFSQVTGADIAGFYAAKFRTADDILGSLPSQAYLVSGVTANDRAHGICRHRHVFETLLCAPGPSFVGIRKIDGQWQGIPAADSDTPQRDAFVTAAHAGAIRFVQDFAELYDASEEIPPSVATALLEAILDDPSRNLAEWLGALEFDDAFAFPGTSTLVNSEAGASSSVWREGAKALSFRESSRRRRNRPQWEAKGPYGLLGWRHLLTPFVAPVIGRIGDVHDVDHYRDDPIGFFRRLSDPRYRRIGRILYPRD
ncbi:hypothetical protein [Pseudoruegeria sp. HB172150]|uniref:hypothetical protein n=1 Tax=Pseudoruegeria sp. HB172150 TaxID=2721164 RepID=UPI0015574DDB|nr:hypothetical protein [Pseudoruegeria sp. HB172150]